MSLYQILAFTIHGKRKKVTTEWNEESELPDGSYSLSDIQEYFNIY